MIQFKSIQRLNLAFYLIVNPFIYYFVYWNLDGMCRVNSLSVFSLYIFFLVTRTLHF